MPLFDLMIFMIFVLYFLILFTVFTVRDSIKHHHYGFYKNFTNFLAVIHTLMFEVLAWIWKINFYLLPKNRNNDFYLFNEHLT